MSRTLPHLVLSLAIVFGCGPKQGPASGPESLNGRSPLAQEDLAQVRYRPVDPPNDLARQVTEGVPQGQWDAGLAQATETLLSLCSNRRATLDPATVALVLSRTGFPGQARVVKRMTGGAFPPDIVDQIAATGGDVDIGFARRDFGDGLVQWIVGWAPRPVDLAPLPRDLPLDGSLALRVESPGNDELMAYIASPQGPVLAVALTSNVTRWLEIFHTPGAYRVEVVRRRGNVGQVALLFDVFVDQPPPEPSMLLAPPKDPPHPMQAEATLLASLNELRRQHGLPPVLMFPPYVSLAREHSALMASRGQVGHAVAGLSQGVASRATEQFHPRAEHFENVAAAGTAEHAMALVVGSPGHLQNMLCTTCTHVAIGVALEPVLDRRPRLFVTWELLAFPNGEPSPIDRHER